ncbi:MAG: hypothetical protein H0X13_08655 [Ramlibacter sp.]|nr:hypothetical protein [Ramlibacter sp.]
MRALAAKRRHAHDAAVRLLREWPQLLAGLGSLAAWRGLVAEVARWDAPVQNTRRFAAADITLAGHTVTQGQGVLVVLASQPRRRAQFQARCVRSGPRRTAQHEFRRQRPWRPRRSHCHRDGRSRLQALYNAAPLDRLFGPCTGFRPLANARVPAFAT